MSRVSCPRCGKDIVIPDDRPVRSVRCANCGAAFRVSGRKARRSRTCDQGSRSERLDGAGQGQFKEPLDPRTVSPLKTERAHAPMLLPWFNSRWFHVAVLPSLWLLSMGALWMYTWGRGERIVIAAMTNLPVMCWVALIPGFRMPPDWSATVGLTAGVIPVALVGLVQDLLDVSWRLVAVYPLSAIIVAGLHCLAGGMMDIDALLSIFCVSLYVLSVLSCVVCGGKRLVNALTR